MRIQYLEVVTFDVDSVCSALSSRNIDFGKPVQALGNARTASLSDGSMIGVRAPMSETEEPVTRAYLLVDDVEAALEQVVKVGGEIAHPPLELPSFGIFAIYILGGVQHGFWQL